MRRRKIEHAVEALLRANNAQKAKQAARRLSTEKDRQSIALEIAKLPKKLRKEFELSEIQHLAGVI